MLFASNLLKIRAKEIGVDKGLPVFVDYCSCKRHSLSPLRLRVRSYIHLISTMKTSPCPDFIDYWGRGTLWCLGIRVWRDRCQAIKCEPDEPGASMVLLEDAHSLPFYQLQGQGAVPAIVVAIAIHMTMHPESDLMEVLSCNKTLEEARRDAERDYL